MKSQKAPLPPLAEDCPKCKRLLLTIHAESQALFPALSPKAQERLQTKLALLRGQAIQAKINSEPAT